LNQDILQKYDFSDVKNKFLDLDIKDLDSVFWQFVKNNIEFFSDTLEWRNIIISNKSYKVEDKKFLMQAADLLPSEPYTIDSWDEWTSAIKIKTGKKGKDLFMPLRKALTGKDRGPELKYLLPLLSKDKILQKFGIIT
jgi:glutamyl-tRNA synthetase